MQKVYRGIAVTQEDKELLIQELCARLPYGVHCCVLALDGTIKEDNDIVYGIVGDNIVTLKSDKNECYMYYQIKPYLRPMSSMTEEENEEYIKRNLYGFHWDFVGWCNSKHLDYRGLIEKGLALEAPEGMYSLNNVKSPQ